MKLQQIELKDTEVNVKLKLAALWTSFMFLYIYVDHFHLYMPGSIEEILAGKMFVFDITQVALLIGLASVTSSLSSATLKMSFSTSMTSNCSLDNGVF